MVSGTVKDFVKATICEFDMTAKCFSQDRGWNKVCCTPGKVQRIIDEISKLNPKGEFLFEKKNGNRVWTYEFRRRIKNVCEDKVMLSYLHGVIVYKVVASHTCANRKIQQEGRWCK